MNFLKMDDDAPKSYVAEDSPRQPRAIDFDLSGESADGELLFEGMVILPDTPEVKARGGAYCANAYICSALLVNIGRSLYLND